MTLDNKQVIDKFPVSLISLRKSPFSELFVIDPAIEDYGIEDVLSFFHLTLQEYLAACHLASLNEDQQVEVIEKHKPGVFHIATMLKFYCGLIDYKTNLTQLDRLISISVKMNQILHLAHCAYESQNKEFCRTALKRVEGIIKITFTMMLTPADFSTLTYFISSVPETVNTVFLRNCLLYEACINEMADHGVESFVPGYTEICYFLDILSRMKVSYKNHINCPIISLALYPACGLLSIQFS